MPKGRKPAVELGNGSTPSRNRTANTGDPNTTRSGRGVNNRPVRNAGTAARGRNSGNQRVTTQTPDIMLGPSYPQHYPWHLQGGFYQGLPNPQSFGPVVSPWVTGRVTPYASTRVPRGRGTYYVSDGPAPNPTRRPPMLPPTR